MILHHNPEAKPLPVWVRHKHVALRPVDSPSLAPDLYRAAARIGGQHSRHCMRLVTLDKPVNLLKRVTLKADERVRSGL